jgi:hypothetical protein
MIECRSTKFLEKMKPTGPAPVKAAQADREARLPLPTG